MLDTQFINNLRVSVVYPRLVKDVKNEKQAGHYLYPCLYQNRKKKIQFRLSKSQNLNREF